MRAAAASPKSWPEWRLRHLLRKWPTSEQRERLLKAEEVSFVPMEAVGENGGVRLDAVCDKTSVEKGYTLFFDGDVVVAKITPCFENCKGALAAGLRGGVAYGTTELHVLSAGERLTPRFLFYLSISQPFRVQGEASMKGAAGQKRVPDEFIQDFRFRVPPLTSQDRIAHYLDAETARIDGLVAEKERMLALLEEKRAALTSRAVTRGLNPRARMKASGLAWLGEIPKHWQIFRLKHFGTIGNGCTPSVEKAEYWASGDDGFPWLNSSVVNDEAVVTPSRYVTKAALAECHLPRIQPPAVLVGITGEGKTRGMCSVLRFLATTNQHLAYVKPSHERIDCEFLRLLLTTAYTFLRSESDGAGSTKGAITCEQLANFAVPVPPLPEQQAIVNALAQERERAAEFESTLKQSIALLKERRSALITAAVRGQVEPGKLPA